MLELEAAQLRGAALAATMVTPVGHFEKMHHPVLAPAVAYLLAKLLLCAPHVCECVYILDFAMRFHFPESFETFSHSRFKIEECFHPISSIFSMCCVNFYSL